MNQEWAAIVREANRHYARTGTKLAVIGQRWSYGGRTGWHYVAVTPFVRQIMGRERDR